MTKVRTLALVIPALLAVAGAVPAHAASCCGGGNGSDGFVLPKWKGAIAGSSLRIEDTRDLRDSNGDALHTTQWRSTETKLTAGGAYRILRDLQASVSLPFTMKQVTAGATTSRGFGMGDASLQARYEIMDEEMCFVRPVSELSWFELKPSVHWVTSLTLPTGRTTGESTDALGADVTGRGLWVGDTGVELTKIWGRFGNTLNATVGYQSGYEGRDAQTPPAFRGSAGVGMLYFFEFQHSLTVMASHRQERSRDAEGLGGITTTGTTLIWNRIFNPSGWGLRVTLGQSGYLQGRNTPMFYDGGLQLSKFL